MRVSGSTDAVGSPLVRLTGSCTVPELSEVGVSGGGGYWGGYTLIRNLVNFYDLFA